MQERPLVPTRNRSIDAGINYTANPFMGFIMHNLMEPSLAGVAGFEPTSVRVKV